MRGDKIECNCPRTVGRFRADVDDRASVAPEAFDISLDGAPDAEGRYVCPNCKAEVARFLGQRWQVVTQR